MDPYRIDGHKLMFHVRRVADWLEGERIYPIYVEVSPSGACNHRCTFCALDYMGYRKRFLDAARMNGVLAEMGRLGVKSVMFGGEGEPLLHRDIDRMNQAAHDGGMDTSFTTNGVWLKPGLAEQLLPATSWIKVSINAGTAESYSRIHRAKAGDFETVLANLAAAADIRARKGYPCTLGMQILLLPENAEEVDTLAERAREIGMDYLVVKPYSQHLFSRTDRYRDIQYRSYRHLADRLERLNTDRFQVIFRLETMHRWDDGKRSYEKCLALPFWAYIDAGGNVWGCSAFLGDARFLYGNVNTASFEGIWQGEARKRAMAEMESRIDVSGCRCNCRMDKINAYLWELQHPAAHVNFI